MKKNIFSLGVIAFGIGVMSLLIFGEVRAQEEPVEGEKVEEQEPVVKEKQEENVEKGVMFHFEPFIVNLAKSQGSRFLKVTISLEMSSGEVQVELEKNLRKINDSILMLLSTKAFEDVYSVQGKFTLKGEITTRVNQFLTVGQVKGAYFTEFIIQ